MVLLVGCGGAAPRWRVAPHDIPYQTDAPAVLHPIPLEREYSDWYEALANSTFVQLSRLVSPGYHLERLSGGPPALDVNAFGKVPDSEWFQNRIGRSRVTAELVFVGPNRTRGPAPGPLLVTKAKLEGVTPGFFVRDSAGERWLVKFDPPGYPELNSAAEVISTKLLYAVGYHVPENHVVRFVRSDLEVAPGATMNDRYRRNVTFTEQSLGALLDAVEPEPDGRLRAVFSRFVDGRPVGPFPLWGVREDDPNDHVPHERRRSLRGLWVFYAWLNDTDAKVTNGLDAFVIADPDAKLGYLRHYLIDFGTSLGAAGGKAKRTSEGYEYTVDWERIGQRYLSLGVERPYWQAVQRTPYRGVGVFESAVFDPARWRPSYPNAGFDSADAEDAFWAAAILARVDRTAIDAAVSAGELTEPGASEWVSRVLIERRDKLLRHAFRGFAPFDDPAIVDRTSLLWLDLERVAGLPEMARSYEWSLAWAGPRAKLVRRGTTGEPRVDLAEPVREIRARFNAELEAQPFIDVRLRKRPLAGRSEPWLTVHLRVLEGGELLPVGLER